MPPHPVANFEIQKYKMNLSLKALIQKVICLK